MSGLLSGSGSNIYPGRKKKTKTARKEKDEDEKLQGLKKKKDHKGN